MKKLVVILSIVLIACNNNADKEETVITDTSNISMADQLPWTVEYDTVKGDFRLRELSPSDTASADPQTVIAGLNQNWPNVQMEFRNIIGDTIVVAIPQAEHLTQRMGSSGPVSYMALATYNLTEVRGIKFVKYEFEEGDHLSPGVYSRDNFSDFK